MFGPIETFYMPPVKHYKRATIRGGCFGISSPLHRFPYPITTKAAADDAAVRERATTEIRPRYDAYGYVLLVQTLGRTQGLIPGLLIT